MKRYAIHMIVIIALATPLFADNAGADELTDVRAAIDTADDDSDDNNDDDINDDSDDDNAGGSGGDEDDDSGGGCLFG